MALSLLSVTIMWVYFLAVFVNFSLGFAPRDAPACPRVADVAFGWYFQCAGKHFNQYNQMGTGERVSGDMFIQAFDGHCTHQCDVFDCLKDRYNVEECSQDWQDKFYEGVNLAESVCDGQRLRPAVRQLLTGLRLDTSDPRWAQCSMVAFPSISQCNNQLRDELNSYHGVDSFWMALSEMDFTLASNHLGQYMASLTQCVYNRCVQAGCDPSWAKLVAVVALDGHNSPLSFGVNTTEVLLNIGHQ